MATLIIRNIDSNLMAKLREQASRNNRSVEEEARDILTRALSQEPTAKLALASRRAEPS